MVALSWSLLRCWTLVSQETGMVLSGQYEASELTERPGPPAYASHTALSSPNEILQFLHGSADRITFRGRVYASAIEDVLPELNTLKEWSKADEYTKRPPVLTYLAGTGDVFMVDCVIESLGDIVYDRLTLLGNVRGATFQMTLRQYVPFTIEGEIVHETRYARARIGEYHETLAEHEYGRPELGILVRREVRKAYLEPADVVKLPSVAKYKKTIIKPESHIFEDAFVNKETPARTARLAMLDLRSAPYVSHVLR